MRAPDRGFDGYTDAQWAVIAAFVKPANWASDHPLLAEYLAQRREYLTGMAARYASRDTHNYGSPRQRVQRRKKHRAALVAARRALDHPDLGVSWRVSDARKQARAALDALIADFKMPMPITRSRAGNKNAARKHIEYWRKLAEYLEPGYSPKQLIAFMHACSRPVFPRETTQEAVGSFAYRFGKRARV
jgi:hypothetical protein